jgi:hypothetical protein
MITIEIPNYIRQIVLSASRKEEYYYYDAKAGTLATKKGKPAPTKYNINGYAYSLRQVPQKTKKAKVEYAIFDNDKQEFVVANPKAAGKPKYYTINSQDFYSGNIRYNRTKITQAIKANFLPYVCNLKPFTEFPIEIELYIYDVPGTENWDILNRGWIYIKCFEDLIKSGATGEKIEGNKEAIFFQPLIPDDNIKYLHASGRCVFIPIKDETKRKMIFIIRTKVDMLDNPYYELNNNETKNI